MVTDEQVKRLRRLLGVRKPLCKAAARAEMSEKTARRWRTGALPSEARPARTWRTRPDAFADVWPWVEAELGREPKLEALTIFTQLQEQHPGRFQEGQLRTLQRHVRQWRATQGPGREVMFAQVIVPGRQGQSDFTCMNELAVTIGGEAFPHLLYHFQLPYSNWEWAGIAFSETFEALAQGLQDGLWALGRAPHEHRTDNLSAATHNLKAGGRSFNERYEGLLGHYRMKPSANTPGKGHENGDVEQAHHRVKRRVEQALLVRGARDFASQAEYEAFFRSVIDKANRARSERLAEDLAAMQPLPARRLESWKEVVVRVSPGSTVRVDRKTYSVRSQLIGREVWVRIYADLLEVRVGQSVVERLPRLRGTKGHLINYRHVVHSLVRKPGAFRGYRYRDELYPTVVFRKAYDALVQRFGEGGDREYLRVLHLAATGSESAVTAALENLLGEGAVPELAAVRRLAAPATPAVPVVRVRTPDLAGYDGLLTMAVCA